MRPSLPRRPFSQARPTYGPVQALKVPKLQWLRKLPFSEEPDVSMGSEKAPKSVLPSRTMRVTAKSCRACSEDGGTDNRAIAAEVFRCVQGNICGGDEFVQVIILLVDGDDAVACGGHRERDGRAGRLKKYGRCSGCENSRLAKTPTFPQFRSCLSIRRRSRAESLET